MSKRLSILICSLEERKDLLDRLLYRLKPQKDDRVEILTEVDDRKILIGKKRNILMRRATGQYVAYVDDDDLVSFDYVRKILKATKKSPDCCGMEGIITFRGKYPCKFIHSKKYKHWSQKDGVYYRPPNHLNPIKREIARHFPFPELNKYEDRNYSTRAYSHLKSEIYINDPIYFYLCSESGEGQVKGVAEGYQDILELTKITGDFSLKAKLRIKNLAGSAAGFVVGSSVLGFAGRNVGSFFVEGNHFKGINFHPATRKFLKEGEPFEFKVERSGDKIDFFIDSKHLFTMQYVRDKIKVGFRPMRSDMKILSFSVKQKEGK